MKNLKTINCNKCEEWTDMFGCLAIGYIGYCIKREKRMKLPNELTQQEQYKIFTLIMGECWHEWEETLESSVSFACNIQVIFCCKCGKEEYGNPNINFSTPEGFHLWMAFVGKQEWLGEMYYAICFEHPVKNDKRPHEFYTDIEWSLNQQLQWLYENVDKWGWEECPCPPEFKGDIELKRVCPYCDGINKIKHKALEAWEGM